MSALLAGAGDGVDVIRRGAVLSSRLAVADLVCEAMAAALAAAADLAQARGLPRPSVTLDLDHVAVAACSERHVRLDGEPAGAGFDPLSAWFTARDGWVRTHGNYAHHRAALLRALGADPSPQSVATAIAGRAAHEVEDAVVEQGGCAAAVRTEDEWASSEPGRAVRGAPVVAFEDGPRCGPLRALTAGELPCAGVRVLDLTQVIAGPVGTRTLAALGADVVRVEDPRRPEPAVLRLDGGLGKRWVRADFAIAQGRAWLDRELARADVVVDGLRPGALARFGVDAATLARRHPQITYVSLSAWGEAGPWGARRGFDSLVQAATGIADAVRGGGDGTPPGALPVQALDHATAHLLAAAVLRALAVRARDGASRRARLALAATAGELLRRGVREPAQAREVDPAPYLVELDHRGRRLTVVAPPGTLDGRPLRWPQRSGRDPDYS